MPFTKDITDKDYWTAPIFISPDWKKNEEKALILIQGSGEVRAGVWSRKVWTEHSLDYGSMLPQIKFAVENKMACLVMNPNFDGDDEGRAVDQRINTMEKHCNYVFKKFVVGRCQAKDVYIIAHSAGGKCFKELFKRFTTEFEDRVKAVVLTDSAHKNMKVGLVDKEEEEWIFNHTLHFVKSNEELGIQEDNENDPIVTKCSAGHREHEYTTGYAWPLIQKYFRKVSGKTLKVVNYCCASKKKYEIPYEE